MTPMWFVVVVRDPHFLTTGAAELIVVEILVVSEATQVVPVPIERRIVIHNDDSAWEVLHRVSLPVFYNILLSEYRPSIYAR